MSGPARLPHAAGAPPVEDPMIPVDVARSRVLAAIGGSLGTVELPIEAALGWVAATEVRATTDLPPWDNSAMDGYAVRAADIATASEARAVILRIAGEFAAGGEPAALTEGGSAIRIATGARLPAGADAVVQVELTTPLDAGGGAAGERGRQSSGGLPAAVAIHAGVAAGTAIRRQGSDLRRGSLVLEPGTTLGPAAIGLVAGAGTGSISVYRRPVVGVLATGDEVRAAGSALGGSGIPDANGPALRALARAAGAEVIDLGIARDELEDVVARLRRGVAEADVVIVSGGVSVGPYDLVRTGFDTVGSVDLWRVARPARQAVRLRHGTPPGRTARPPVRPAGQPGLELRDLRDLRPARAPAPGRAHGSAPPVRARRAGRAGHEEPRPAGLPAGRGRALASGAPARDAQGRLLVHLAAGRSDAGQGSHILSTLASADALAAVPEPLSDVPAGAEVEVFWLDR